MLSQRGAAAAGARPPRVPAPRKLERRGRARSVCGKSSKEARRRVLEWAYWDWGEGGVPLHQPADGQPSPMQAAVAEGRPGIAARLGRRLS